MANNRFLEAIKRLLGAKDVFPFAQGGGQVGGKPGVHHPTD